MCRQKTEQPRLIPVEQHLERPVMAVPNQGDELLVALQAKQRRTPREQPAMAGGC